MRPLSLNALLKGMPHKGSHTDELVGSLSSNVDAAAAVGASSAIARRSAGEHREGRGDADVTTHKG